MGRFTRSTATVTGMTAAGMALGFWANLLIAARFGVSPDMDAYLAATTLPSWITVVLTTTLAATFLPVFTEYRQGDTKEAWKVAGSVTSLVALAGLFACLAGMMFAGPLIRVMTPGLDPERAALAASMLRWLLPTVALSAVNQLVAGVFYAEGRFVAPLLIRLFAPLFTVAYIVTLSGTLHVRSLALATLSAHAAQTAVLAFLLLRAGRPLAAMPDWRHPGVRKVLRLSAPLLLAMCFYKLGPAFERWMASGMGPGAISTLGYATRLTAVIQPLLISGVALSGFALMAEHVSRNDMPGLRAAMSRSCNALFFASVPLAVLLCGFAGPLVGLVFERGAFSPRDTANTAQLFALYALGLPAGAVGTVVGQAFYAFQDMRVPIVAGILDLLLFAALGLFLVPHWGLAGLPVGFVLALYVTTLLITQLLARKTGFSLWTLFARPFAQSLAAAVVALTLGRGLQFLLPTSDAAVATSLAAAAAAYLCVQHFVFRSPETARMLQILSFGRRA